MVVVPCRQVDVEKSDGERGATVSCAPFQAQALCLALELGAEWFDVSVVVVACGRGEHDESASVVVW